MPRNVGIGFLTGPPTAVRCGDERHRRRLLLPHRDRAGAARSTQSDAWHPDGRPRARARRAARGHRAQEIDDVVLGCGLPEGATGHNIGRNAALAAGFPVFVPGITINRYCGSGISAISIAANRIVSGEADIVVASGVESISLVQFNLNLNGFFYEPLHRMPGVWWTMIQTADFVAQKYGISREAQDEYSLRSQQRVAAAAAAGKFADEIVPFVATMSVTDKATGQSSMKEVTLDRDEGPRPDTTLESSPR